MRISQESAASSTGRRRRHNEDAYVCDPPLFAVADGMGGARGGEIASSLAAGALRDTELDPGESPEQTVVRLIQAANLRVHERAVTDSAASGMGTTMTVALFRPDGTVVIGHVGDSRAYVLREGRLDQLTDDHSLVAELVRRGELSPEQAEVHPQRSVITRALGTEPEVDVDAFTVDARDGDVFLLCSDGLTTMVDPDTIAELLGRHRSELEAASRALIKAANDRGGEDNITTVLFAVASNDDAQGGAPPEETSPRIDDEDTLHPGEVAALADAAPASDAHVGEAARTNADLPPGEQTIVVALPAEGTDAPPAETAPEVSRARLLIAQLVAVALAAAIVFLVVKGFAL
jgi:protein phosphatase